MSVCECGCNEMLTGKQKRFKNDTHRARYWSDMRRKGAALGKGLDALLPKKNGKPKCGHPGRSKRLAKTLNVFLDRRGQDITTLEIHAITNGVKVSTDIDDLRRAGYSISKAKYERTTEEGCRVYSYRYE